MPTGAVTFKTNDVPLGPPVPLVNGVAALDTAALPHGFTPVWAEYPGQGQFLGSTGSVVQLVNTPPMPGYHVAYVMQNEELALPVAALLAEDDDPDGDPLNIVEVSALSTNGGTAALVGTQRRLSAQARLRRQRPDHLYAERPLHQRHRPHLHQCAEHRRPDQQHRRHHQLRAAGRSR